MSPSCKKKDKCFTDRGTLSVIIKIKIAFFDIDGTLVSFTTHRVPESTLHALEKLSDKGVEIVIVTGRSAKPIPEIGSPCPAVRDLRLLFQEEGTGQMCIFTDAETERKLMKYLPGLTSSRWCDIFADLNLKGIDKGSGVEHYLNLRGYTKDNAISFGDGGNDIAMLASTGIGVAMGNANDELKYIADYITNDIDCDGVHHALRHFGLI